jgi:hypothetical protein
VALGLSAARDQRAASTYIFGAICPKHGKGSGLDPAGLQYRGDEPAENIWRCTRVNWFSNRVFESCDKSSITAVTPGIPLSTDP